MGVLNSDCQVTTTARMRQAVRERVSVLSVASPALKAAETPCCSQKLSQFLQRFWTVEFAIVVADERHCRGDACLETELQFKGT